VISAVIQHGSFQHVTLPVHYQATALPRGAGNLAPCVGPNAICTTLNYATRAYHLQRYGAAPHFTGWPWAEPGGVSTAAVPSREVSKQDAFRLGKGVVKVVLMVAALNGQLMIARGPGADCSGLPAFRLQRPCRTAKALQLAVVRHAPAVFDGLL